MKISIAVAGSGGHIFPSLALGNYLESKKEIVTYISDNKEINKKILENNKTIFLGKKMKDFLKICKNIFNADVVIGFGGRISFFCIFLGKLFGKKCYFHEQNCLLGDANKYLYPLINRGFSYFKIEKKKMLEVGNPVEDEFCSINSPKYVKKVLLVSGSLGSNELEEIYINFARQFTNIHFDLIEGNNNNLNKYIPENVNVIHFLKRNNLENYDFVITRAGATTIAELIKLHKPFILLPSPYVKNNHQEKNATYLFNKIGIDYLNKENLTLDALINLFKKNIEPFSLELKLKKYQQIEHFKVCQTIYEEIKK